MIKYLLALLIIFFFYFSSLLLFPLDFEFYHALSPAFSALNNICFHLLWLPTFIFTTYSIFKIIKDYYPNQKYLSALVINYFFYQVFCLFYFWFNNFIFSFFSLIAAFVTGLLLYQESSKFTKKAAYYLLPYLGWLGFLSLLIIYHLV